MNKNTIVFVASPNPERYSFKAVQLLNDYKIKTYPVGLRKGKIDGQEILLDLPKIKDIHTITLYINPVRQKQFYSYILNLKPKRIIFNPGTENAELIKMAQYEGIKTEIACTIVLLKLGNY